MDTNTEQRRNRLGELLQIEKESMVPRSLFTTTLWALACSLIGVVAFLLACWFFGIAQIIIN